jgi:hypothetical protein
MTINSGLTFIFPEVMQYQNDDYIKLINPAFSQDNADANKYAFSTQELSKIDLNEESVSSYFTAGSTSSSNDIPWYDQFFNSIKIILNLFLNLMIGWLSIFAYFHVPTVIGYPIMIGGFIIQAIGTFTILQVAISSFSGVLSFFR